MKIAILAMDAQQYPVLAFRNTTVKDPFMTVQKVLDFSLEFRHLGQCRSFAQP